MFSLSSQSRIFIHALPTDMRKSFDALCGIVKGDFQKDILDGDYFVFFNRVLDRCKILMWDRDGLVLVYKRLERGCFQRVPADGQGLAIEVDLTTLTHVEPCEAFGFFVFLPLDFYIVLLRLGT